MDKIDKIMANSIFIQCMSEIEQAEKNRIFCRHDFGHSLDVARICYIMSLERNLGFDKEIIYATALLHDIGRSAEYRENCSHHQAGARLAEGILKDAGFTDDEISQICMAIKQHKQPDGNADNNSLSYLLYKADKLSRRCFDCEAALECYWSEDTRNKGVDM